MRSRPSPVIVFTIYNLWAYPLRRPVDGMPNREELLDHYSDAIIERARFIGLDEHWPRQVHRRAVCRSTAWL